MISPSEAEEPLFPNLSKSSSIKAVVEEGVIKSSTLPLSSMEDLIHYINDVRGTTNSFVKIGVDALDLLTKKAKYYREVSEDTYI